MWDSRRSGPPRHHAWLPCGRGIHGGAAPGQARLPDEGHALARRGLPRPDPGRSGSRQARSDKTWQSAPIDGYTSVADLPTLLGRQEEKQATLYDLRPDGHTDRAAQYVADTDTPAYRISAPMPQTVNKRTLVFGDSFTNASSRYLAGGFSHLTMLAYPAMSGRTQATVQAFADAEAVVVQVVERGVAAGNLPLLEDGFIERVRQTLAARPIR